MDLRPMSALQLGELEDYTNAVIHIHNPRSRGTTYKRVLDQIYPNICNLAGPPDPIQEESPMGVFIRDKDSLYWTDRKQFLAIWQKWLDGENHEPGIYHGHTPLHLYPRGLVAQSVVTTWLRHPVSLILSWFRWDMHRQELWNFDDVWDFIEQRPRQNIQTQMLSTREDIPIYYGISEYMPNDIGRLANALLWPGFDVPWTNGQAMNRLYIRLYRDEHLIKAIKHLNQADMDLYSKAVRMRALGGNE